MGFPFALITQLPTIINGIIKLVDVVEGLVRKPKAGAEKKKMVLDSILADIEDDAGDLEGIEFDPDDYRATKLLFFDGKYNWTCLLNQLPALRIAISNFIDAVVAVKNILAKCDE